jgi:membrane-associated protein
VRALTHACATQGLVVTPFLPGDSLLFAAGTLAAMGALSLPLLVGLLFTAAVMGDTLNYVVGAPTRVQGPCGARLSGAVQRKRDER